MSYFDNNKESIKKKAVPNGTAFIYRIVFQIILQQLRTATRTQLLCEV